MVAAIVPTSTGAITLTINVPSDFGETITSVVGSAVNTILASAFAVINWIRTSKILHIVRIAVNHRVADKFGRPYSLSVHCVSP